MKTLYMRKDPKGKLWGEPCPKLMHLDYPSVRGWRTMLWVDYIKKLKSLGWTIVKVMVVEVKKGRK